MANIKTLSQLLEDITNIILSGGRRTKADKMRQLTSDMSASSLNIKDGGRIVEKLSGYSEELEPEDPRDWITKKYYEDNLPSGGGGSEVTNTDNQEAIKLGTNWVNPNDSEDKLYYLMTSNLPTGQNENDYLNYVDMATRTAWKATYEKIDGTLAWVRMPRQISISGL